MLIFILLKKKSKELNKWKKKPQSYGKKFKKYEIELFWECQEYKLFEAFNDMSLKKEKFNVS